MVLASLLAYVAVLAIWSNRQMLDTDNWTQASSEMLAQPTVRRQVSEYLVDQLYANVDVESELRAALPERAQPLAGPAAGALRNFAEQAGREVLARPRAQTAWENANRAAHTLLLKTLNGGGDVVSTTNGTVVLDLKALLGELEARTGVGGRLAAKLPPDAAQLTVLESDQLSTAQSALNVLDALPIVTVVLSLLLFGLALVVAPARRRQSVRGYGFGLIVAGIAAIATGRFAGDEIISALVRTEAGKPAAQDVWTIVTELLDQAASAAIFYGAVMVIGAWLAGPTRLATGVRRTLAPYLREPAIAYGAFAALAAAVVLWWAPTPALRNPVTAILLVILFAAGFEALRRRTAREFPDADRHTFELGARERISGLYRSARDRRSGADTAVVRRAPQLTPGNGNGGSHVEELERLAGLRERGVLDEEEFKTEKARVLGADAPSPSPT